MAVPDVIPQRYEEHVSLDRLTPHPANANEGDQGLLSELLDANGFGGAVLAQESTGILIDGETRWRTALAKGMTGLPVIWMDIGDDERDRFLASWNESGRRGRNDESKLVALLTGLAGTERGLEGAAFDGDDLDALIAGLAGDGGGGDGAAGQARDETEPDADDELPEPLAEPISQPGDLWLLGGRHRLLVGDSTDPAQVQRVTEGRVAVMLHADPPYGMGKESDGVLNDNLYGPKLDTFQMRWWKAWLPALAENGSAYVWGNAPDLWRLWWAGGLSSDPGLLARNEIVWDKGSAPGMHAAGEHSYVTATERCLFLMRGQQFLGNLNKDDFPEVYEPLRAWLCAQRDQAGWTSGDANRITGTQMAGHWFTRSQFIPVSEKHYRALQEAAAGRAFTRSYADLFGEMFPQARGDGNAHRRDLAAQLREQRTQFDNTHDVMTDVWRYPRVTGEERFGHATPKPVRMAERAILTSSKPGDLVGVPFGGTGPEFIAGQRTGRDIVGIELEPRHADAICLRFERATGIKPERVLGDGSTEPVSFRQES